jgi:hypothetical protein
MIVSMKKLVLLFLLIARIASVCATSLDSVRISLLTCAPGTEVYALFGHTAIRYENPPQGQDWVYNYGMFSFSEPNFVMRFVKGETDYQLGRIPFRYFEAEYAMRGSAVYQQVLNLTHEEKVKLISLLEENYRPVNRIYRYNYFYDNCTTRARDKIEESIDGQVVYPEGKTNVSFRHIIHEFTAGHDWSEFGIDLCLGADADKRIGVRQQMFAPFYMMHLASEAMIHRADTIVPFVSEEFKVVDVEQEPGESFWCSPMTAAILLLFLTLMVVGWGIRRGRIPWAWDVLLFGAQGIGGIVVSFLFFFSVHPTVGSNWLIILFNPLPLIYLPWMIYKHVKGKKDLYHGINAACLTSFIILMPLLQQKFNLTVLPLALCLLLTSVGHLYIYRRKRL